jgi:hypothetical protein
MKTSQNNSNYRYICVCIMVPPALDEKGIVFLPLFKYILSHLSINID